MIEDSSKLIKGQKLKVDLERVRDRLPLKMLEYLNNDSTGELVGYKMSTILRNKCQNAR